ncbi:MAG: 1-acyl-sn-glycerol-3-phosphate acyltransferase, partial [Flavisolibacter sp.]
MFYNLLKFYSRLAIKIYCRKIIVNKPEILNKNGPLLLAANHPNSFFDGIIITTLFEQPVFSLARGDVFKYKRIDQFLRRIQLLPIYRTSEGVKNLSHNYTTFDACQKTFERKGIILIFCEGRCENEWHLRSLKKGTARLATTAWQNNIDLEVIPVGINYSSFKKYGKEAHIFFGDPILSANIMKEEVNARQLIAFNEDIEQQLKQLVYEIEPSEKKQLKRTFAFNNNNLFLLPAFIGWLVHSPLYYPC